MISLFSKSAPFCFVHKTAIRKHKETRYTHMHCKSSSKGEWYRCRTDTTRFLKNVKILPYLISGIYSWSWKSQSQDLSPDVFLLIFCILSHLSMGYRHQRVDDKLDNPPQGNQEPLVIKTRMGDPRWAWSEQVHAVWQFLSSMLWQLVGQQEGHPACKNVLVMLVVTIWLELRTS